MRVTRLRLIIFISYCVFVINKHFQIRIIENTTLGTLLEVMELNGRIFGLRKVMVKVMSSLFKDMYV